jgi:hypothetical protein
MGPLQPKLLLGALLPCVCVLAGLLLPPVAISQQSRADMEFKSWPREDPGHLEGYCPTRGSQARDWQGGDLEGCTMLDLYSHGLNATTMTELSVTLALHGPSTRLHNERTCCR